MPWYEDWTYIELSGITRRNPAIGAHLATLVPNRVEATAAPHEAESAAYAGLAYLARHCIGE